MHAGAQHNTPWRISADTGGTFTDCLATDPQGTLHRAKVLSSARLRAAVVEAAATPTIAAPWLDRPAFLPGSTLHLGQSQSTITTAEATPASTGTPAARLTLDLPLRTTPGDTIEISTGDPAPILAARLITGTPPGSPLPPTHLRLATTRGTNALLERRGAPTAFFVTRGFADLLVINDQTRPDLFTLRVRKPRPLHDRVAEVTERLDTQGQTLTPLDLEDLRPRAQAILDAGVRVAAVALLNAWRNPDHERQVRDFLLELGFDHVSMSTDLGSRIGLLARAETAVTNAYLAPVIDEYLDRVAEPLAAPSELLVMTSAGSLIDRPGFAPKDSLLSGPAGGVIGAAETGKRAGFDRVISFDMGGTSTDCARAEHATPERIYQTRVGDARIVAPCVAVETVAAGGGSVCTIHDNELRVGPESAGADPGPACYGRGGPLTITDCNLLLGRLDPSHFAVPLDRDAARARAQQILALARQHTAAATQGLTTESLLAGFLDIANQRMAEAVRRITIRRGHDPAEHALVAFGGAGPQHACAIADALDIDNIIIPPDAGLLSAFGLSVSALERVADRQILQPLTDALPTLAHTLDDLDHRARRLLPHADQPATSRRTVELRYLGQDDILELDATDTHALADRFTQRYRDVFSYNPTDTPLELVTARVTATLPSEDSPAAARTDSTDRADIPARSQDLYTHTWQPVPIHQRKVLSPSTPLQGPALLTEPHSTTYLAPGWQAQPDSSGAIHLTRGTPRTAPAQTSPSSPVQLELAIGKLTAIAQEMGERLQRTAISTNVKQRRDFSCAILDAQGRLVVNAPHVPVHLGSMGVCVRAVRDALGPDLQHAAVVTNHPAFGGSHLPDITVIQPVHDDDSTLLGYTAARAHHAEVGGIAPASMAPEATSLAQEGVVIPPTPLGQGDQIDWSLAEHLFTSGPHPSRDPRTNRRDLAAAIHAVRAGRDALRDLADTLGRDRLTTAADTIQSRAEQRLRRALATLPDGRYHHAEPIRGGGPIAVTIDIAGDTARFDFTGSGPVHPRCLNATTAIVTSAVIYVLRLLVDEDLPLNEGLLAPVQLHIPQGLLNPPFNDDPERCPAVAGGNVEISQMLVETMLSALGLCAQSQGTMNNVILGNDNFGFYETLAGGCGALPGFPGESSTHSHMTNTAITDPEVFEHRYPARIERLAIRPQSGGQADWPGGDGLERRYRLLEETSVALLRARTQPPKGAANAIPAHLGQITYELGTSSHQLDLDSTTILPPGALLCIQTPGGAGIRETQRQPPATKPPV